LKFRQKRTLSGVEGCFEINLEQKLFMKKKVFKSILLLFAAMVIYIVILIGVKIFYIMGPSKAEKLDLTNNNNEVLLIIDIQEKYMKALPRDLSDKYFANFNKLINHSRELNTKVIFFAAIRKNNLISSLFSPDIAIQGSDGAKIDSRLIAENPLLFEKYKADCFYQNDFRSYLNNNNVKKIFVAGIATEVCVGETVKGALNKGYDVVVINDAIISFFGDTSLKKYLDTFKKLGAKVMSTDDYLKISAVTN
jgi:nicotinamidase-related amidase